MLHAKFRLSAKDGPTSSLVLSDMFTLLQRMMQEYRRTRYDGDGYILDRLASDHITMMMDLQIANVASSSAYESRLNVYSRLGKTFPVTIS